MIVFILGLAFGIFIGRVYGWMKYSYPESREMIAVKIAERRRERVWNDLETERLRKQHDEILRERMAE